MNIQAAISNSVSNSGRRLTEVETWTRGLLNAIIVGGSTSVTSWLGMAAAHGVGIDVPVLNFKTLGVIFLSGAGVKFFAYLSQGLPALTQTVETAHYEKAADGTIVAGSSKTVTVTPGSIVPKSGLTPDEPGANIVATSNQPPTK